MNNSLARAGLSIVRRDDHPSVRPRHPEVWVRVAPFTMTDPPRVDALYDCTQQIIANAVPGDFVECGVFRGGSSMTIALALLAAEGERAIWLYDTFEGMTVPTGFDTKMKNGAPAAEKFQRLRTGENSADWCAAPLEDVTRNMLSTDYPPDQLRFIRGPVEETLLTDVPEEIALLRLDTDWYASTRVEMEVLFPRLASGGVLIVDDYNSWAGARRAVDEYLADRRIRLMFFPIGGGAVMTVVP